MATPAVKPIVLNDVDLKIAADNFEAHVSKVELVPSTSLVTWKGMTPTSVFKAPTMTDWSLGLDFVQDWETPGSLSEYLFTNEGEVKEVVFKPRKAGARTWTASVILTPGAIGGPVDSVAVASVTLGVQGKPVPSIVPTP